MADAEAAMDLPRGRPRAADDRKPRSGHGRGGAHVGGVAGVSTLPEGGQGGRPNGLRRRRGHLRAANLLVDGTRLALLAEGTSLPTGLTRIGLAFGKGRIVVNGAVSGGGRDADFKARVRLGAGAGRRLRINVEDIRVQGPHRCRCRLSPRPCWGRSATTYPARSRRRTRSRSTSCARRSTSCWSPKAGVFPTARAFASATRWCLCGGWSCRGPRRAARPPRRPSRASWSGRPRDTNRRSPRSSGRWTRRPGGPSAPSSPTSWPPPANAPTTRPAPSPRLQVCIENAGPGPLVGTAWRRLVELYARRGDPHAAARALIASADDTRTGASEPSGRRPWSPPPRSCASGCRCPATPACCWNARSGWTRPRLRPWRRWNQLTTETGDFERLADVLERKLQVAARGPVEQQEILSRLVQLNSGPVPRPDRARLLRERLAMIISRPRRWSRSRRPRRASGYRPFRRRAPKPRLAAVEARAGPSGGAAAPTPPPPPKSRASAPAEPTSTPRDRAGGGARGGRPDRRGRRRSGARRAGVLARRLDRGRARAARELSCGPRARAAGARRRADGARPARIGARTGARARRRQRAARRPQLSNPGLAAGA